MSSFLYLPATSSRSRQVDSVFPPVDILYFRFDNPLLADQRLMLQASLLQYPHLGIFPNAAVYPGLSGAGVRYPSDYYGQNLSGMSLSSKYPDVGGPTWLGLDRCCGPLEAIFAYNSFV